MTEVQKLQSERDIYKNLAVQRKVLELLPEINRKGLETVLADVVSMAMDAEVRAELAEKELREYKNNSIRIVLGR